MLLTLTTAPNIGVLGRYSPNASVEIVFASIVHTFPEYPFIKGFISSIYFVVLIIIAPFSFKPEVTSTHSSKVSSNTTT